MSDVEFVRITVTHDGSEAESELHNHPSLNNVASNP
jgi:hypothetical protein